jgi:hypothetical protein
VGSIKHLEMLQWLRNWWPLDWRSTPYSLRSFPISCRVWEYFYLGSLPFELARIDISSK